MGKKKRYPGCLSVEKMATNESTIAPSLQQPKHYDVFHWVTPSSEFIAANDIVDHYMLHLRGISGIPLAQRAHGETLYVTLQMMYMEQPITPLLESSHTSDDAGTLDEWIIFPIAVCDVPLDATVLCRVHGSKGPVGAVSFHPFNASGKLKAGPRRYRLDGGPKPPTPSWALLAGDLRHGLMRPVPWMDRLVEQRLSELERQQCQEQAEGATGHSPMLSLVFPLTSNRLPVFLLSVPPEVVAAHSIPLSAFAATPTQPFVDVAAGDENLCEAKAAALSKSQFLISNADTQPGPIERRQLNEIARRPLIQLEGLRVDDEMLLWRFRAFLARDPNYFIPFMRCVNWDNRAERQEALKAMQQWKPISFAQALVCLSFYFRKVAHVRIYAIGLLDRQSDGHILRFLLQLVQGVRYDVEDELEQFLIRRALGCWELCCTLAWSVAVEASLAEQQRYQAFLQRLEAELEAKRPHFLQRVRRQQRLVDVLRTLYRTVMKDPRDRIKRMGLAKALVEAKKCGVAELFTRDPTLPSSPLNIETTSSLPLSASAAALADLTAAAEAHDAAPVTLPTHPGVAVQRITASGIYMFKSAKTPIKVPFVVHPEASRNLGMDVDVSLTKPRSPSDSSCAYVPLAYPSPEVELIFKLGDDVRQDQLVVQLIQLVDSLLRQDGLDLCLSPYRVLATGAGEGLVELVPDVVTFQSVQRDVVRHIRAHNPTPEAYNDAMGRFTRSCAGYCVLTFILGIGDRHLENILVTRDGRLLHIDFGYILGNDPKPFPPPMKINKEMVVAIGGPQSEGYAEFKSYCCSAYNTVRKHAPLLLSMLLLMVDASIPQISGDGKLNPRVNLLKVQERLRLDLSNAQATQYIQNVIADSVGSVFTNLWDVIHVAAQATRH